MSFPDKNSFCAPAPPAPNFIFMLLGHINYYYYLCRGAGTGARFLFSLQVYTNSSPHYTIGNLSYKIFCSFSLLFKSFFFFSFGHPLWGGGYSLGVPLPTFCGDGDTPLGLSFSLSSYPPPPNINNNYYLCVPITYICNWGQHTFV